MNETNQIISALVYLQEIRGPQQLPFEIALPLTIINVIIIILGLVGNITVCLAIIKLATRNSSSNYYLFNLAISDLTLLLFGNYLTLL